jgi:hypothetical protein
VIVNHPLLIIVLALLVAVPSVVARERGNMPTPYGRDFIRVDALETLPQLPLQSAPEAEAFLHRIEQVQGRSGPYAQDLSESLLDAANYLKGRGDYQRVGPLLRRAVYVTRINDGLYSALQLPLLEELLDNYLRQGDLDGADEVQARLFNLHRRTNQSGDVAYIEASVAYSNWQRIHWLLEPDPEGSSQLYDIWRLLDQQLPAEDSAPLPPELLTDLIYAQMKFLYLVDASDFGLDQQSEMLLGRQYSRDSQQPDMAQTHMQYLQKIAYSKGRQRLELLIGQLQASGDPIARAEAEKKLGDWFMWHGERRRAAEHYRGAWDLLTAAGEQQQRSQWFGEPMELPAEKALYGGARAGWEIPDSEAVTAKFSVSARGKAKQIKAGIEGEAGKGASHRVYRLLRNTRFRPRLEAGEMVETSTVVREYQLLN